MNNKIVTGKEAIDSILKGRILKLANTPEPRYYAINEHGVLCYTDDLVDWKKSNNKVDSLELGHWEIV